MKASELRDAIATLIAAHGDCDVYAPIARMSLDEPFYGAVTRVEWNHLSQGAMLGFVAGAFLYLGVSPATPANNHNNGE